MIEPPSLPAHASVVVIGGGAMGCSTLYHLAREGVTDAVLLERHALTAGTTWHSAAQVRALRSTRNMTDLIRYSVSLYAALEEETGQATGWINAGSLSIATCPDRLVHIRRQAALARAYGLAVESISAAEAKERWPLMNAEDVIGAVWSPGDGRVSPSDLCAALVRGARARGARVFEHTGVTALVTRGGRITGVETTAGALRCDALVLCTGLWSRDVAAMAGASAPLQACEHFYLLTRPVPGAERALPTLSDHDGHLYIRDESQGLLVGCFEPGAKALHPSRLGEDFAFQLLDEDWDHFEPMMLNALHRLPVLETAEVRMLLNGPESFTPDGHFLLGESARVRGLFLGCGMNSVGLASAGGAGMALAHAVVHGHTPVDLAEVDARRLPACFDDVDTLMARAPEVLARHYEIAYPGRQMETARGLRPRPLDAALAAAGARCGQVYGWERPLYFAPAECRSPLTFARAPWFDRVAAEVRAAHESAAVFDQSTLGKIRVRGTAAERFLDRVCSNDMTRAPGRAVYGTMLNERGGFEGDYTALRLAPDDYRLYVGTTAIERDLAWLRRHRAPGEDVAVEDETEALAVLALMGPRAMALAAEAGAPELAGLGFFRHAPARVGGIAVRAARLSYVGEPGVELTCDAAHAPALFEALREAGATPAGLYAQSAMRIEKRFAAMGHELSGDVTPVEAGLEFALAADGDWLGRAAVLARRRAGPQRRLVSLLLDDPQAVPLGDEPLLHEDRVVGQATSAAFGHRVGRAVALGYVDSAVLAAGEAATVALDIAGKPATASVRLGAVFDPQGARMR
jgi:4-methylaminobutanoate oxidase (formaldehyde-forming)